MLAKSIPGRQGRSFRLLTEETAVKWRIPVGPTSADSGGSTANEFQQGSVITPSSGIAVKAETPQKNEYASGNSGLVPLLGVAFDEHTATLDECQQSGFVTMVCNRFAAQTKQFIATNISTSTAVGVPLFVGASDNAGKLGVLADASAGDLAVGYFLRYSGDWIEFMWFGPVIGQKA